MNGSSKCHRVINASDNFVTMDWSDRYSTPLSAVFSRKYKLSLEWRVELALLAGLEEAKKIPGGTHDKVKAVIDCACYHSAVSTAAATLVIL